MGRLRQEDDEIKASLGGRVRSFPSKTYPSFCGGPQCDTATIVAESLNELVSRDGFGETNQRN